jgi:hypothetical protein
LVPGAVDFETELDRPGLTAPQWNLLGRIENGRFLACFFCPGCITLGGALCDGSVQG